MEPELLLQFFQNIRCTPLRELPSWIFFKPASTTGLQESVAPKTSTLVVPEEGETRVVHFGAEAGSSLMQMSSIARRAEELEPSLARNRI
jgi:hypothetical protein